MLPTASYAGIETLLIGEQQGNCTIRVTHDATPSSMFGTLVFRSFVVIDSVHHPCAATKSHVRETLSKGIAQYIAYNNLKPITSIMVGKISHFPWIKSDWLNKSQSGSYEKMSRSDFNALVSSEAISEPFKTALNKNGLEFDGASCEKMQFYDNGHPMDALCWFKIKGS